MVIYLVPKLCSIDGICLNGGVCRTDDGEKPKCFCPSDYYGENCECKDIEWLTNILF